MKVAIIPARGGSKRIPRKNVREFCGKPMIGWSILAARKAGVFDRIIVSTDDPDVRDIAYHYGAEVPFQRPVALSGDYVGTGEVLSHAVDWLNRNSPKPVALACCIYATAPFIRPDDIREGLSLLDRSGAEYVVAVTTFPFPIQRAIKMVGESRIEMFSPELMHTRSQDLAPAWHDAGQFYWGLARAWLNQEPIFSPSTTALPLPRHLVQDIDSPEDWERAEWMFRAMHAGSGGGAP